MSVNWAFDTCGMWCSLHGDAGMKSEGGGGWGVRITSHFLEKPLCPLRERLSMFRGQESVMIGTLKIVCERLSFIQQFSKKTILSRLFL